MQAYPSGRLPWPAASLTPKVLLPLMQSQAVAVGRGGIVPKSEVPLAGGSVQQQQQLDPGRHQRLCVEDPLTGRDVASGSHKVHEVGSYTRA